MKVIGVTGPSGAGKSVCCQYLEKHGIPWINTDAVYHRLIDSPSLCVAQLKDAFGTEIINEQGGVDRSVLSAIVFSDQTKQKLETLNGITHKFVKAETLCLLDEYSKLGVAAATVDAPLLFEAGFDELCDLCIAVIASRDVRIERIVERDGISRERASARVNAQKTDEYYTSRSKYTITNDSDVKSVEDQVSVILSEEGLIS